VGIGGVGAMSETEPKKLPRYLFLVPAAILFSAFIDDLPYEYFQFLRWIIFFFAILYAIYSNDRGQKIATCVFCIMAVIFNPIIPFYFERETWLLADSFSAALFIARGLLVQDSTKKGENYGKQEEKQLIDAIYSFFELYERKMDAEEMQVLEEIKEEMKRFIVKNPEGIIIRSKELNFSSEAMVCLLAKTIAFEWLSSGHYHIYRGVLGMEGKTLESLYDFSMYILVRAGRADHVKAAKEKQLLKKNISEVG
jgi:hypothetical protein